MRFIRAFANAVKGEPGDSIRFIAASESDEARDGLILRMAGAQLDSYKRLGMPVMFSHKYDSLPIGRGLDIWVEGEQLLIDVVFDQGAEFAREVERMVREGLLRAMSVGWNNVPGGQKGREIIAWEVLETSIVPIPSDPTALAVDRQLVGARSFNNRLDKVQELAVLEALNASLDRALRREAKRIEAEAMRRFVYDDGPVFHRVTWAKELGPKRALPESIYPIPLPGSKGVNNGRP